MVFTFSCWITALSFDVYIIGYSISFGCVSYWLHYLMLPQVYIWHQPLLFTFSMLNFIHYCHFASLSCWLGDIVCLCFVWKCIFWVTLSSLQYILTDSRLPVFRYCCQAHHWLKHLSVSWNMNGIFCILTSFGTTKIICFAE